MSLIGCSRPVGAETPTSTVTTTTEAATPTEPSPTTTYKTPTPTPTETAKPEPVESAFKYHFNKFKKFDKLSDGDKGKICNEFWEANPIKIDFKLSEKNTGPQIWEYMNKKLDIISQLAIEGVEGHNDQSMSVAKALNECYTVQFDGVPQKSNNDARENNWFMMENGINAEMSDEEVTRYDDGMKTFRTSTGEYWQGKTIETMLMPGTYTLTSMAWRNKEWKPVEYWLATDDDSFPIFYEEPKTDPVILDESRTDAPWATTGKNQ